MDPFVLKKRKINGTKSRLFFVIPKKVFPKATQRNKIKRSFKIIMNKFLKTSDFDYTIVIRSGGVESLSFSELSDFVNKKLKNNV